MSNPRLAHRYAKSLIDISQEKGQLENVFNDMLQLQKIIKDNRDFLTLLRSPVIAPEKKLKVLEAITAGRVNELTGLFTKLMITKGREAYLPEVIIAFIKEYKELKKIHTVQLTTAVPVSDEKFIYRTDKKNNSNSEYRVGSQSRCQDHRWICFANRRSID
jgi:F-type H+-transporting ATPase subunit delta